jgi:hypothetical protein
MAYTPIDKPSDYFNTVTWTGDGVNGRTITTGHNTNFIWGKERSNVNSNWLIDIIRGAGKRLRSDTTNAEDNLGAYPSFVTNGFTVPATLSLNGSGRTFVGWSWLAGGTAVSNTDGSITSSVSANTTAGFSIVSYTGTGANATVGHGLGVAPSVIIVKNRSTTGGWPVYHKGVASDPETDYLLLHSTDAVADNNIIWNDTAPTSTVFSIGTGSSANTNTNNHISYCFAEKKGFSKFGSYTGNGSTNGTFVYTGFKPAFLIAKKTNTTSGWGIFDNKRTPYNVMNIRLLANSNGVDDISSDNNVDFVSNGIKFRSSAGWNASASYIYMAFAENPFVSSTGIPTTAR